MLCSSIAVHTQKKRSIADLEPATASAGLTLCPRPAPCRAPASPLCLAPRQHVPVRRTIRDEPPCSLCSNRALCAPQRATSVPPVPSSCRATTARTLPCCAPSVHPHYAKRRHTRTSAVPAGPKPPPMPHRARGRAFTSAVRLLPCALLRDCCHPCAATRSPPLARPSGTTTTRTPLRGRRHSPAPRAAPPPTRRYEATARESPPPRHENRAGEPYSPLTPFLTRRQILKIMRNFSRIRKFCGKLPRVWEIYDLLRILIYSYRITPLESNFYDGLVCFMVIFNLMVIFFNVPSMQ